MQLHLYMHTGLLINSPSATLRRPVPSGPVLLFLSWIGVSVLAKAIGWLMVGCLAGLGGTCLSWS